MHCSGLPTDEGVQVRAGGEGWRQSKSSDATVMRGRDGEGMAQAKIVGLDGSGYQ